MAMNTIIFAQASRYLRPGMMGEARSPDTTRRSSPTVFYHRPERSDERREPRHHSRATISAGSIIPSWSDSAARLWLVLHHFQKEIVIKSSTMPTRLA
jgi:hypothetical protein